MALIAGTRLGPYEVLAAIGSGGMGEVYRARDTRLNRDVALKLLPEVFAQDADRLARFQREAEVLASLNHPHIAQIYGLEDSSGVRALVMELVAGSTLASRIAQGAVPLNEALTIARQIVEALEAAHEKGIIHRDLKPANVMITPDGRVKVLDFGLAKALEPAGTSHTGQVTNSPTLSLAATQAGIILGTAAYMSPEQAKGHAADRRSDVFSFGCVLYEMLTGHQAFQADTAAETLAAVLMRESDLSALPPHLNPRLRELVRRCLTKQPKGRWQAVGDVRLELEAIAADPLGANLTTAIASQPLWRRAIPIVAAAVVVGLAASAATWWYLKPPSAGPVTRFSIALPDDLQFVRTSGSMLAVSPDGARIVYIGNRQLFLRSMSDMDARPIPGTANLDPAQPFFSPNGQWVGFYSVSDATLKKIAVGGGTPVTLCKLDPPTAGITTGTILGPSWDGDQILFARQGTGIMRVSENGGEPEVLIRVGLPDTAYGPQLLPGGKAVLFSLATEQGGDRWDKAQIVVQPVPSGDRKVVVRGGSAARYVPSGHLVYALGATLLAIPFDLGTLKTSGGPISMLEGVRRASLFLTAGAAQFAVSTTGSLVYLPGTGLSELPRALALADRTGRIQSLGFAPLPYYHPRISPDGKQVVVGTDDGKEAIVWVGDLRAGASLRRLTFGGRNMFPIWSRDGRLITFQSDREGDRGLFRQPADGSGTAERLTKPEGGLDHRPEDWNLDEKTLLFAESGSGAPAIWTLSLDGDRRPKPLVRQPPINTRYAAFSPDGRWFAYVSTEVGGRFEVFVEPFPRTGANKNKISTDSGRDPVWSRDGTELFYATGGGSAGGGGPQKLYVVDVRTQPAFGFGTPTLIPIQGAVLGNTGRHYDVMPDGKRFVVVMPMSSAADPTGPSTQQINVVLNWFEELKTRVPTGR